MDLQKGSDTQDGLPDCSSGSEPKSLSKSLLRIMKLPLKAYKQYNTKTPNLATPIITDRDCVDVLLADSTAEIPSQSSVFFHIANLVNT